LFVYTNTPNNPTAAIYTRKVLNETKIIVRDNEMFWITDDVYAGLTRDGHEAIHPAELLTDEDRGRVPIILLWSFSKKLGMAGDKIGGPCFINCEGMAEMEGLKNSFKTDLGVKLGSAAIPQYLADEILRPTHLARVNEELGRRAKAAESFGLNGRTPFATIYYWGPLPEGPWKDDKECAIGLARDEGVSVTPGNEFWRGEGKPKPYVRISLTESSELIEEGGSRAKKFMGID
ncbi:MAG: aminotransferase class I/II-fold pyridoxal phosphate-dependent enzyme, partial [Candidatus Micrarchaeota archaeon]|nr:aminotransferase class I/II-fold pyridoxal phosphate-dependent enzyme [Candidatus Micrarchaeota archaeon]